MPDHRLPEEALEMARDAVVELVISHADAGLDPPRPSTLADAAVEAAAATVERGAAESLGLTADDAARLGGIAGDLERLSPDIRRHFHIDRDGRDARYLRILQERILDVVGRGDLGA